MAPWNSNQKNADYALQGVLNVELNPYDRTIRSFMITVGKGYNILRILEHFLKDLDNPEFVTIEFPQKDRYDPSEVRYGARTIPSFFVQLSVHRDDLEKIDGNESIRIICNTDAYPENKEAFVDFFEELRSVLRY